MHKLVTNNLELFTVRVRCLLEPYLLDQYFTSISDYQGVIKNILNYLL